MTIDPKHQPKAAVAADALRAALIAVEDCGADEELTSIVMRLADDRTKLCLLFGLDPAQAFQTHQHTEACRNTYPDCEMEPPTTEELLGEADEQWAERVSKMPCAETFGYIGHGQGPLFT